MKKKIFLIAALCLSMLGLAACSKTDPATVDYNGVTYEELQATCQSEVEMVAAMSEEERDSIIEDWDSYISQGVPEMQLNLVSRWGEAVEECGDFIDYGEFEVTKSGKTLTAAQTLDMEDRDMILTCVYTYHSMELDDITIDPIYTVGEKMSTALMNTLMGMLIVFTVLILISLIIYCFNIFPYLEKKKAAKAAAAAPKTEAATTTVETVQEQQTEDGELIAVIAAAIAAAEGTSTEGFVVRSIRRR